MNGDDKRELITGYVNLRDHLEALWKEREMRLKDRFKSIGDILEATAKEMAHRLEVLNHAHEQSLEDRADFVRKPVYEDKIADYDRILKAVQDSVLKMETRYEGRIGLTTWIAVAALVIAGISLLLKVIK